MSLPSGWWQWLAAVIAVPTNDVVSALPARPRCDRLTRQQLEKNGMDAYMFLRFLRMLTLLFGSITLLTWLVLLPVDTAGLRAPNFTDGLSRLSWGKYASPLPRPP